MLGAFHIGRRGWRDDPLGAEIGRDHIGIGGDVGRRAVGDQAALMQHGDAIAERQHAVDVVLDQQHRMAVGELADQGAHHLPVGFRQPGQRLVEQEQAGIGGECDGDFQQAALAVAEICASVGGAILQSDGGEQRPGARVEVVIAVGVAPQAPAPPVLRLHRDPDVLERREVGEHAQDLE